MFDLCRFCQDLDNSAFLLSVCIVVYFVVRFLADAAENFR